MVPRGTAASSVLAVSAALMVLASGCAMGLPGEPQQAASRGQSLSQAKAELAHASGLRETDVEVDTSYSGLIKRRFITVEATVSDEGRMPQSVDYLAQVGWSVNEVEPDDGVFVRIRFTPQPIIGKVAQRNGWTTATYSSSTNGLRQLVLLPKAAVRQRFGDWPGSAPAS